jgi:16S rRNA (adenine1518-N6/adenine1519-N6)-dimethyltransferase
MNDPKKELGQHWLHDDLALEAICDDAEVLPGDTVLEIGPGLGTLTAELLRRKTNVVALEFDHDLAIGLTKTLSSILTNDEIKNLTVVEGDIRKFNYEALPKDFKICANIPYYLTSNLLRLLCDSTNQPAVSAILMQKEVAERIVAEKGKMGLLSCIVRLYFDCELGTFVPKSLFTPPPKVDSQVLILYKRSHILFDVDTKKFIRLLKAGFSEKRKTLRNSLSGGLGISKEKAEESLAHAGIDHNTRGEALSMEQWKTLYDTLDLLSIEGLR